MYWKIIQPVKHKSVLVTLKRKKLDNLPNTLVEVNGLELAHTFVHYHTHSKFLSSGDGHSGPHLHPTASQTAIRLSAGNPRIKEEKLPHVKMACQRTECFQPSISAGTK